MKDSRYRQQIASPVKSGIAMTVGFDAGAEVALTFQAEVSHK